MKNQFIPALAAALVLVLGIQTYVIYRLNDKVKLLSQPEASAPQKISKKPNPPTLSLNPPALNNPFFDDKTWDPYEEMQRMQAEMEQVFGDSFSRFHSNHAFGSFEKLPEVDLKDTPDAYIVTVNAPGADKSSLDVKLEGQQLQITIATDQTNEANENNGKFQRRERFVGRFHRILMLPGPANAAKMKTDYTNGVVTITLPKQ